MQKYKKKKIWHTILNIFTKDIKKMAIIKI